MKLLSLSVITPEGLELQKECEFIQVHTSDAYLGILPGHASLISDVVISKLSVRVNGVDEIYAVGDGVISIDHDEVKIMVDSLERAEDIDLERALASKDRAEKRLDGSLETDEELDIDRAKAALARALNRINVVGK